MSYTSSSRRSPRNGSRRQYKPSNRRGQHRFSGQSIDPRKFIKSATFEQPDIYQPANSFEDFCLHDLLHKNILAKGFTTPSAIQDKAIPVILEGGDVIGLAKTGTGKTAAFALPALNRVIKDPHSALLIVAPTRELAQQIEQECRSFARSSGLTGALLIGGTNMGPQLRDLRTNPKIVIGTPGRIKDHLTRKSLDLKKFNIVVLDEVDRMLDMGFVNDVTDIVRSTNPKRQSLFFSATMDSRVRALIDKFTYDPVTIQIADSPSGNNIHQDVVGYFSKEERLSKLHDLLIGKEVVKALIFEETQRQVEKLQKELTQRGFDVEALHGGKSQGQRQKALVRFRDGKASILVATDVASRGIDVADISHVINYSPPKVYEDYVHRIGRTGRAGRTGYALTFIEGNIKR